MPTLVKENINVIKKIDKLLTTFNVSFVIKIMNLVKDFVQLGEKSVNCAKLKITLKIALFAKKVKNKVSNKNNSTNFTESNEA